MNVSIKQMRFQGPYTGSSMNQKTVNGFNRGDVINIMVDLGKIPDNAGSCEKIKGTLKLIKNSGALKNYFISKELVEHVRNFIDILFLLMLMNYFSSGNKKNRYLFIMSFIPKNTSKITNTVLTDVGRKLLSEGNFNVKYFQVGDSEVTYAFSGITIENGSVLSPEFNAHNKTAYLGSNKSSVKYPIPMDEKSFYGLRLMFQI